MEAIHALIAVYAIPFYNFIQCWTGICAPLTFPWR